MLGVLLESSARPQRRAGGAALSVAMHLAIIAFITMTTVRIAPAHPNREPPTSVHFTAPKTVSPPVARVVADQRTEGPVFRVPDLRVPRTDVLPQIDVPRSIPTSLPPIDVSRLSASNDIVIGSSGASRGLPHGIMTEGERLSSTEWRGTELLMRIVTTAKPRYPESLRQTGIEGTVVVRFTVDTSGRVDTKSAQIISSTHPLFGQAVLEALGGFRFKAAEVGGRRVAALAEMPFEFRISGK